MDRSIQSIVLPKDYINSWSLCHDTSCTYLDILLNITVIPYVDNIMLIKSDEHKLASTLEGLVRNKCPRGWEINTLKTRGLVTSVKRV